RPAPQGPAGLQGLPLDPPAVVSRSCRGGDVGSRAGAYATQAKGEGGAMTEAEWQDPGDGDDRGDAGTQRGAAAGADGGGGGGGGRSTLSSSHRSDSTTGSVSVSPRADSGRSKRAHRTRGRPSTGWSLNCSAATWQSICTPPYTCLGCHKFRAVPQ